MYKSVHVFAKQRREAVVCSYMHNVSHLYHILENCVSHFGLISYASYKEACSYC